MYDIEINNYIKSIMDSKDFIELAKIYDPDSPKSIIPYIFASPFVFINFYKYFQENRNAFSLNNKRIIDLENIPHIISSKKIGSNTNENESSWFAKHWIILPNLSTALLKQIPIYSKYGKYGEGYDAYDLYHDNYPDSSREMPIKDNEYHILLIPEIAKQIGLDCAEYYLAKSENNFGFSLSPNFLNEGDELIPGNEIVGPSNLKVNDILFRLENYLSSMNVPAKDIENIKLDFIKQSFFNRFIENQDSRNINWGIVANCKSAKIAPIFDIDFSCDIYAPTDSTRILYVGDDNSITSFVEEYRNYPKFIDFIKFVLDNFDINKTFDAIDKKHSIEFPDDIKDNFRIYFNSHIDELKLIYDLCLKEKQGSKNNELR